MPLPPENLGLRLSRTQYAGKTHGQPNQLRTILGFWYATRVPQTTLRDDCVDYVVPARAGPEGSFRMFSTGDLACSTTAALSLAAGIGSPETYACLIGNSAL